MDSIIRAQIRNLICAWMFICIPLLSSAQEDMYWTVEARSAYDLITDLRIEESMKIIRLQAITHPENLIWPYLKDYASFLQIFVREDIKVMSEFLENSSGRIDLVSVVPESNPLSLMAQSQMLLHQCALRMQQGQFASAAADLNKAFRLLKKNHKLHPDDYATLRLYACLKIAFGAIPDDYRWLVSMVSSLSGSIDEGLGELHSIVAQSDPINNIFHKETVLLTALAEGKINDKPQAGIELMNKYFGKTPANKLIQYVMATLYIAAGNNEGAIRTLVTDVGMTDAARFPFLDFMLGKCKLYRGDEDADIYFKNFLLFHKGKHFIKETYQKLAWISLLKDDRNAYFDFMQQILIKGADQIDEDQQAMAEAVTKETPHPVLLRSRLLFDGGYYEKAGALLNETLYKTLTHRTHRLEYLYRKGRILHELKNYAEALHYYNLATHSGQYEPYYYACSAALHSGMIHEALGSEGAATRHYLICLQIRPETYATSLHQKARTGLNRMGQ